MNAIASINFSRPSWDLFIIIFFIAAAFVYGLSLGRDRIIVILVSMYMALAIINTAPFLGKLSGQFGIDQLFVVRVTAFIGVFLLLFFLLSRSALLGTIVKSTSDGRWWQTILFSFLHIGLLISLVLSFFPAQTQGALTPLTTKIFATDIARFLWVLAPILAMVVLRDKKKDE